MKKQLSIVLTLVMIIFLVNLNNNHTKADETNDEYTTCTGGTCTVTKAIHFNGSTLFYDTTAVAPPTDMMECVNGIITIKQNIVYNPDSNNYPFLDNSGPTSMTVKLAKDISITDNSSANTVINSSNTNDLTIDGDYYKLTIKKISDGDSIYCKKLTLNNVILDIDNSKGRCIIANGDDIVLNNSKIKASTDETSNSPSAIVILGSGYSMPQTITSAKGYLNGAIEQEDLMDKWGNFIWGTYSSFHKQGAGYDDYGYVKVEINEPDVPFDPEPTPPTPSPSEPVVKDESCEKVIGPTWHWNNSKGICEDYGVVGTYTR